VNVSAGGLSGMVDEKLTPKIQADMGPLRLHPGARRCVAEVTRISHADFVRRRGAIVCRAYNVSLQMAASSPGDANRAFCRSGGDGLLEVVLIPKLCAPEIALLAGPKSFG